MYMEQAVDNSSEGVLSSTQPSPFSPPTATCCFSLSYSIPLCLFSTVCPFVPLSLTFRTC